MNQPKPEQEPSMEEILASIRRIISEDGDEAEPTEGPPALEAEAEPIEAEAPAASDDDVLELTQVVSEQPLATPEPETEPETEAVFEPESEPEPEPEPEPAPDPEPESTLELVEPNSDDAPLQFEASSAPPEMEEPLSQHTAEDDSIVADSTALMASAAMSKLTESPSEVAAEAGASMQIGDKTIEALVRELMRPMLKEWLDRNLPAIVERIVEREVSRVAERLHND